jgi:alkanesulfonate monooxygenase SsuD/methylene tetrahydromethanopterin reductase-like flavin-dependent oxidoreductase (luciferase family)
VVEAEFSAGTALTQSQELARLIEEVGFHRLGVSDVVLWPTTFVVQALCAQARQHIQITGMVSKPYSRYPVALAGSVATVDECPGRSRSSETEVARSTRPRRTNALPR